MDARPLPSAEDPACAIAEVTPYFEDPPGEGTPEADRFDVLCDLITAYEDREFPVESGDPIVFLLAFMEISARSQSDFARLLGSPSRASEVLRRKRGLTVDMIHRLHSEWGVPADALVEPYKLAG